MRPGKEKTDKSGQNVDFGVELSVKFGHPVQFTKMYGVNGTKNKRTRRKASVRREKCGEASLPRV